LLAATLFGLFFAPAARVVLAARPLVGSRLVGRLRTPRVPVLNFERTVIVPGAARAQRIEGDGVSVLIVLRNVYSTSWNSELSIFIAPPISSWMSLYPAPTMLAASLRLASSV